MVIFQFVMLNYRRVPVAHRLHRLNWKDPRWFQWENSREISVAMMFNSYFDITRGYIYIYTYIYIHINIYIYIYTYIYIYLFLPSVLSTIGNGCLALNSLCVWNYLRHYTALLVSLDMFRMFWNGFDSFFFNLTKLGS